MVENVATVKLYGHEVGAVVWLNCNCWDNTVMERFFPT
jgi:hypothetical protein